MGVRKRLCCRTVYLCVAFRFCFGSNSTKIKTEKKLCQKKLINHSNPIKGHFCWNSRIFFVLVLVNFCFVLLVCDCVFSLNRFTSIFFNALPRSKSNLSPSKLNIRSQYCLQIVWSSAKYIQYGHFNELGFLHILFLKILIFFFVFVSVFGFARSTFQWERD